MKRKPTHFRAGAASWVALGAGTSLFMLFLFVWWFIYGEHSGAAIVPFRTDLYTAWVGLTALSLMAAWFEALRDGWSSFTVWMVVCLNAAAFLAFTLVALQFVLRWDDVRSLTVGWVGLTLLFTLPYLCLSVLNRRFSLVRFGRGFAPLGRRAKPPTAPGDLLIGGLGVFLLFLAWLGWATGAYTGFQGPMMLGAGQGYVSGWGFSDAVGARYAVVFLLFAGTWLFQLRRGNYSFRIWLAAFHFALAIHFVAVEPSVGWGSVDTWAVLFWLVDMVLVITLFSRWGILEVLQRGRLRRALRLKATFRPAEKAEIQDLPAESPLPGDAVGE